MLRGRDRRVAPLPRMFYACEARAIVADAASRRANADTLLMARYVVTNNVHERPRYALAR